MNWKQRMDPRGATDFISQYVDEIFPAVTTCFLPLMYDLNNSTDFLKNGVILIF